jgi:hypothetical protein
VIDDGGAIATRLFVHTDDHRRRCARCGHTGHVGQFCKAGSRAPGADAALWSALQIPPALLPQPAEEMEGDVEVAQPARPQGPPLTDWAADVDIEAAGVNFSATHSTSSVDAGSDRMDSVPVAAGQAAASLDAAPAAGAAASTVDPSSVDPSSVDPSSVDPSTVDPPPLPSPSPSPSPSPFLSPSPLLLQLSTSSASVFSLPLGQGKTSSTLDDASVLSLPLSSPSPSPISSVSSSSSQKMDRSRSPRPKRSASVILREYGVDDLTGPAAGRPGNPRGRSGGKGGLPKAAKVSSPSREKTPPSQKIEDCASP